MKTLSIAGAIVLFSGALSALPEGSARKPHTIVVHEYDSVLYTDTITLSAQPAGYPPLDRAYFPQYMPANIAGYYYDSTVAGSAAGDPGCAHRYELLPDKGRSGRDIRCSACKRRMNVTVMIHTAPYKVIPPLTNKATMDEDIAAIMVRLLAKQKPR